VAKYAIDKPFPFQGPQKFTQSWIIGLKKYTIWQPFFEHHFRQKMGNFGVCSWKKGKEAKN
jgi:hypothetical protein